jgi:hypothetical protein
MVSDASGVMTGWRGTDPNRFVEIGVGLAIDPIIIAVWDDTESGQYWRVHLIVDSILPDSGGNNEPFIQMRWDDLGSTAWGDMSGIGVSSGTNRVVDFLSQTGGNFNPRPNDTTTVSFRMANINDFIGGIFTPRSFAGVTLIFEAIDLRVSPTWVYTQVVFGMTLGMEAAEFAGGTTLTTGAHSRILWVG